MEDDEDYSDSSGSDGPQANYISELYQRLTSEAHFQMNDDSDDSVDLEYLVYDNDDDVIDLENIEESSTDSEDIMSDEEDVSSQASTLLNDDQEQLNQSGTDTEIEPDHEQEEEEEEEEEEDIVPTSKKIKLDEPEEVLQQNIANESFDEDQKCPICLEVWSNAGDHRLCSLRCGHLFGLQCIMRWFNVAHNASGRKCPECNAKASKKDIRVLYAKALKSLDTTEIEKLKQQLKDISANKEIAEKELQQYRTKEVFYKQEIDFLKQKILELQKLSERKNFDVQYENIFLRKNKVFDICSKQSCRVMAYNPWHKTLVISSGNAINRIFVDTLSFSLNSKIHNGMIRDLAFQKEHPNILLSVSFDKKVSLTDIRNNIVTHSYQEDSNLWSCCWSSHSTQTFFVGGARGDVTEYDIRYLQSGVNKKENAEDRSPVVSLSSVPTTSSALRAGGYLACQLNSCSAFSFKEGNYVGNRINLEGPFISLRYNEQDNHVLLSCRGNAKNPSVRHLVCTIEKSDDQIKFNTVHSFNAGHIQKLLSRPCYMNLQNDTVVVANNESIKSIVAWSVSNGQEIYRLPVSEPVVDVCSFECDTVYQAILTSGQLHLYNHKDENK